MNVSNMSVSALLLVVLTGVLTAELLIHRAVCWEVDNDSPPFASKVMSGALVLLIATLALYQMGHISL